MNSSAAPNGTGPCSMDDSYKYPIYSAIYGIVCIIGMMGNAIALYVFLCLTRTKSASTIYLINLALADMFFVLTLPLRVVYYVRDGDWPFGDAMCRISSFAFYANLYSSIFFLTGLSVTRYLAVVHPVRSLKAVTARRAVIACVSIWVFVTLVTSPFLLSGQHVLSSGRTLCFESSGSSLKMIFAMNYLALLVGVLIPFAIIVVCYAAIARTLMKTPEGQRRDSNVRKRAVRMIVLVLTVFVVCFIPYHVQRTLLLHQLINRHSSCDTKLYLQKSVVATVCFAAFNSCLDPLIYFFVGEKFRERFMSAVRSRSRISSATSSVRPKDPLARSTTRDAGKLHMQPLEGDPLQKEEEAFVTTRGHRRESSPFMNLPGLHISATCDQWAYDIYSPAEDGGLKSPRHELFLEGEILGRSTSTVPPSTETMSSHRHSRCCNS